MIEILKVSLRAICTRPQTITATTFVQALNLHVGERSIFGDGAPGFAAGVILFYHNVDDFAQHENPSQALADAIAGSLRDAAAFLSSISDLSVRQLTQSGFPLDIFFDAWIELDQFDLDLPVEFLAELARLCLRLRIITND